MIDILSFTKTLKGTWIKSILTLELEAVGKYFLMQNSKDMEVNKRY